MNLYMLLVIKYISVIHVLIFLFQPFDKCFLGSSVEGETDHMFCGQISTVYLFSEALSPQQIHGVYQLGPSYKVPVDFVLKWLCINKLVL